MPIFVYLLVQGFLYTKNFKRYIFRIFILATVTQISLFSLGYINQTYYPNYYIGVNNYLGILYSYTFSLILLAIVDKKKLINKLSENQNLLIRINTFILIALAYLKLKIEFDMRIPFMVLEIYGLEKLFEKNEQTLLKQEGKLKIFNKIKYISLILVIFSLSLSFMKYSSGCRYAILASVIFIAFYNGERGTKSKLIQYLFYLIFPLQHIILYTMAMNM